MKKYKVDVIIPIYNSLNWLKVCIYSLFTNTNYDILNKVYLIDDCSNEETLNYLKEVEKKYGSLVEVIRNKKNLGFVKNCNIGLKKSTGDYVLLLNSDCIVTKNAIEKMAYNMSKDKKIGLLCPISSVAANLSFSIPEGMNFMQLNDLFEKQFRGKIFDACTVVGNCLMISRNCIEKTGYLDEIFEKGYTEETDYQFKAHAKGFKAKVCIDTFVYHQCRVSFGESEEQLKIRERHLKIFFDRWGEEYNKKMKKYQKNDPIKYIKDNLNLKDLLNVIEYDLTKIVDFNKWVDYMNILIINGKNIKVICSKQQLDKFNGVMLFSPEISKKNVFSKMFRW